MPLKIRIVKWLISWLWNHYQHLLREAVVPTGSHVHLNPKKKRLAC
jgi:hypothetical protein